jgi:rhodanese-related sulfurtransferase
MSSSTNIKNNLPFFDEISAANAFEILSTEENSFLVDVRTENEWKMIGTPDLGANNAKLVKISWRLSPNMALNEQFFQQFAEKITDKTAKIFFLCKVGGRSYEAASACTNLGYKNCYNVIAGFEAMTEDGKIKGWKPDGLPWHIS